MIHTLITLYELIADVFIKTLLSTKFNEWSRRSTTDQLNGGYVGRRSYCNSSDWRREVAVRSSTKGQPPGQPPINHSLSSLFTNRRRWLPLECKPGNDEALEKRSNSSSSSNSIDCSSSLSETIHRLKTTIGSKIKGKPAL